MAAGTYTIVSVPASIKKVYDGLLAKTLVEKSPATARLALHNKITYGNAILRINWPAVSDSHDAASNIPDGGALPAASREVLEEAILDWAIYISTLRVGRLLMKGATPEEYFKSAEGATVIASELNRIIPQIARSINNHIVSGVANGANAVTSLFSAVGTNTNTYAGISRVGNTFWQPYVNNNGGVNRAVTRTLMEQTRNNLIENREAIVTEIWAGATAWDAIRTLINTIYPGRNVEPERLQGAAMQIFWEDTPVIKMPGMDANATRWLDFESGEGIELKFQHPEDFLIQEENTDSYDKRMSVAAHCQLVVHNPWKQGSLDDLI